MISCTFKTYIFNYNSIKSSNMTNNLENEIFPMLKTKEEIQIWLNKHHINNYIIHDNLTVDVGESISLFKKSLKYIPIQFGVVHGNFQCSENNLVTLKGCPKIVYGTFECASNQLNSLKYAPEYVEYSFTCANNKITSLEYLPKIGKAIACHKNQITRLITQRQLTCIFMYWTDFAHFRILVLD